MADVVEPAPCALLPRRGEQLDRLGPLAAQRAPELGVGAGDAAETLEADDHVAFAGREPELVEPCAQVGDVREREQPRRRLEALAEQRAAEPEALERAQRVLADQQPQLVAEPVAGHGRQQGGIDQRRSVRVGLETEPVRVADEPQHPRRVVDERAVVQHAQDAARRRSARAPSHSTISSSASRTAIALTLKSRRARSSSIDAPELHIGERARPGVGLAARARQVEREPVGEHGRRPEAIVDRQRAPTRSAARRATATASPSTTRSSSRGTRPSSASRTAPPTTYTPRLPSQGGEHDLGPGGRTQVVHGANVPLTPAANLQGP